MSLWPTIRLHTSVTSWLTNNVNIGAHRRMIDVPVSNVTRLRLIWTTFGAQLQIPLKLLNSRRHTNRQSFLFSSVFPLFTKQTREKVKVCKGASRIYLLFVGWINGESPPESRFKLPIKLDPQSSTGGYVNPLAVLRRGPKDAELCKLKAIKFPSRFLF